METPTCVANSCQPWCSLLSTWLRTLGIQDWDSVLSNDDDLYRRIWPLVVKVFFFFFNFTVCYPSSANTTPIQKRTLIPKKCPNSKRDLNKVDEMMSFPQHCQNHIILTPQLRRKWTIYSHPKHWRHGGPAWRTVRGSINFISRTHLNSDLSLWPHSLSHPHCCLRLLCCQCIHIQSRQGTLTVLFCLDTRAGTFTSKALGKPRTGADCWELRPTPEPELPDVGVWSGGCGNIWGFLH